LKKQSLDRGQADVERLAGPDNPEHSGEVMVNVPAWFGP